MEEHNDTTLKDVCAPRSNQAGCQSPSNVSRISTNIIAVSEISILMFDGIITCHFEKCSKMFTNAKTYRGHRTKIHQMSPYYCVVCCAPYASHNELLEHVVKESHSISCPMCSTVSLLKPLDITMHFINYHKPFLCSLCSRSFNGRVFFRNHAVLCGQEEDLESKNDSDFNASMCVEIKMNSSFSDKHSPGATDQNHINQSIESKMHQDSEEPAEAQELHVLPDTNVLTTSQSAEEISSETETADSESQLCSSIIPESNNQNVPTPDLASQSLGDSFPDLELLNHCVLGSDPDDHPSIPYISTVSPNSSTLTNMQEDAGQWIGHNVDMFLDMSEKHKSTFKYTCGKCAAVFTTEHSLKKHEKTHEHVCKHCSQRFYSLPEYRTHVKAHHMTDSHFPCSVCGHICEGLKNLMIHEMHHRLNSAFKHELENFATFSNESAIDQNEFDCEICQEHVCGLSMWLRHKIWHRWVCMWTSYVLGRSFKGTFSVEDATRLKHVVEGELILKWRDCLRSVKIPTKRKLKDENVQLDSGSISGENQNDDNVLDDTSTIPVDEKEDESEDEPDCEGLSHAISGWMSYWQSYLGLDETPPSWVKPILNNLRSQWRNFHISEQDVLYCQMDQIGVMIRAQKSGDILSEGPWVRLEKMPERPIPTRKGKMKMAGFTQSPDTSSHGSTAKEPRIQTIISPKSLRERVRLSFHNVTHRTSSTNHVSLSKSTGSRKRPVNKRNRNSLSPNVLRPRILNSEINESPIIKCRRLTLSPVKCSSAKKLRSKSASGSKIVEHKPVSPPNLEGGDKGYRNQTLEGCSTPSKHPVICLARMQCSSTSSTDMTEERNRSESRSLFTLSLEKTIETIKGEILDHPIPKWAENLVNAVFYNPSLNQLEKENKLYQILGLLKSYYFHHMELEPKMRPVVILSRI